MRLDLRRFIDTTAAIVARHQLARPGTYRRWLWSNDEQSRDLGLNAYGSADAANILYTIQQWPPAAERSAWVETMQSMQDADTGLFQEGTHHPFHTTAHCIAALELFDARPAQPLTGMSELRERAKLEAFLGGLEWTWNPWGESHRGAGLYAALVLAREVDGAWEDWYFDWLWEQADPQTGFWRRDCVEPGGDAILFHHLAGTFHYLFNHEYARRPLRYPERLSETCLRVWKESLFPLCETVGFAEVDWVYCLNRSVRQSGSRYGESRDALRGFARRYVAYLEQLDPEADEGLNDLHQLFGALCALAELQQALPGELRTEQPLRLVLDRRPFI